jgi:hypothetical protein
MTTTIDFDIEQDNEILERSREGNEGIDLYSKDENTLGSKIQGSVFIDIEHEKLIKLKRNWQSQITQSRGYNTTDAITWPKSFLFSELVSSECLEFCDSHQLNSLLEACFKKAHEVFSNITKLFAEYDYFRDEESEDSGHIVIRVEVSSDQQTALGDYDRWVDWVVDNLTPQQRRFFTLTVKRV